MKPLVKLEHARMEWATPENRELVRKLVKRVEAQFAGISHGLEHRWYYFYKGQRENVHAKFLVLRINKKVVRAMIKVDPASFEDPKDWAKKYGMWFFYGSEYEEWGFPVSDAGQFDYALGLIKQSYDLSHE
jgi:predicted transport protein